MLLFFVLKNNWCFIFLQSFDLFQFWWQKLEGEKHEIENERDEKLTIIEKMSQAAKDREVEFRVNGKKNDQLVDLRFDNFLSNFP